MSAAQDRADRFASSRYWPLSADGPLPERLFADTHLERVFVELLPKATGMPWTEIRRSLKHLIKREVPHLWEQCPSDENFRSRWIVAIACNHPALRREMSQLSFRKSGRRHKGQLKVEPDRNDLTQLIWRGYTKCDVINELIKKLSHSLVQIPSRPKGKYLTADIARSPEFIQAMAADVATEDFARLVVLFASLLTSDDMQELIASAYSIGCEPLLEALSGDEIRQEVVNDSKPHAAVSDACQKRTVSLDLPPKQVLTASHTASSLILAFNDADADTRTKMASIDALAPSPMSAMATFAKSKVEAFSSLLEVARASYEVLDGLRERINYNIELCLDELGQLAGYRIGLRDDLPRQTDLLGRRYEALDALRNLLNEYAFPHALREKYRRVSQRGLSQEEIEQLYHQVVSHRAWISVSCKYAHDLLAELEVSGSKGDGLIGLGGSELAAVATACSGEEWVLGCAISMRAALDASRDEASAPLAALLCESQSVEYSRSLLYFLLPEHVNQLKGVHAKRIGALEYIRDALEFGPIAKLSEPHAWLRDSSVVGRSSLDILDILVNNSDRLSGASSIARLLRPAGERHATRALQAFASAPIGMQGNFKRLREIARDKYITPLMSTRHEDANAVSLLIARLENEDTVEEIQKELLAQTPGDLDSRHLEQLSRYLARCCILLRDYEAELRGSSDSREASIRQDLIRAHDRLAKNADSGGISWFESELRRILQGTASQPQNPTFQGPSGGLLISSWNRRDNEWAAQLLDLPHFYSEQPVKISAVLHASVKCMAEGKRFDKNEIAESLAMAGDYREALAFAMTVTTEGLEEKVRELAAPLTQKLTHKFEEIVSSFGSTLVDSTTEAKAFIGSLRRLDFDQAQVLIELLELTLNERRESMRRSEQEGLEASDIIEKLRVCGASHVGPSDLASLRAAWRQLLDHREEERSHLLSLIPALRIVEDQLPELALTVSEYRSRVEEPRFWLTADAAVDFTLFIEEGGSRLARWAESASLMKQEERHALSVLAEWYIRFVIELVEELSFQDDSEATTSALGRLMEVADCISTAASPHASLMQLKQVGEIDSLYGADTEAVKGSTQSTEETGWSSTLPEVITRKISELNWPSVHELSLQWKDRLQPEDARVLRSLASACTVLAGGTAPYVEEDIEAAVGFLTSKIAIESGLSDAQISTLAKTVFACALRVDSPAELTAPPKDLNWGQLLSIRSSPLKKGAVGDGFSGRVLNDLLLGCAQTGLAQAIWDGASGVQDPAQLRSSLLAKLYELELIETITKLAARQESGIVQRINHLFELRSVASARPDLVPVAIGVADQIAASTKSAPFRTFLKALPFAAQTQQTELAIRVPAEVTLRRQRGRVSELHLTITVSPMGLVPEKMEAVLVPEDDVSFLGGAIRKELTSRPVYVPAEYGLGLQLGSSWAGTRLSERVVRIRIRAKTITGELCQADGEVLVKLQSKEQEAGNRLDDETLLDAYPGVSNTPAIEDAFIGRIDELELLHKLLISARRPSPVLLVGLRRIGKTSLLFAMHRRHRNFTSPSCITFYVSLAERRVELTGTRRSVSAVVFGAVVHALTRQNLGFSDQNFNLCSKVREYFNGDARTAREELQKCFDEESLSDSLSALREKIASCVGNPSLRLVVMMDEAEALVAAYMAGGAKKIELEQFLQSVRELSQNDENIAFLLAGSNHISVFSREYKNAFFGSSQIIELSGLRRESAASLVSPMRIAPFVAFDREAIDYAYDICGGMPQFLWQVGATVSHIVRSGAATRNEVRRAISIMTSHESTMLPFKSYEILEPIDSVIGLEEERERDLLWMLLYRVAQSSSLIVEDAATAFVVDQVLLQLDDRDTWKRRIAKLAELGVLKVSSPSTVSFQAPIFAEGFRSPRNWQEYNIRQQKVTK